MSYRNRFHGRLTSRVCHILEIWNDAQTEPRGAVYGGDVGCRFADAAESVVGIDVAYWTAEQLDAQPINAVVLKGPPTLAVEILSPSNTVEEITEKVGLYLEQAVQLVWVVNPYDRTITIHRPSQEPRLVNLEGDLTGEDVLSDFRVAVRSIFA